MDKEKKVWMFFVLVATMIVVPIQLLRGVDQIIIILGWLVGVPLTWFVYMPVMNWHRKRLGRKTC